MAGLEASNEAAEAEVVDSQSLACDKKQPESPSELKRFLDLTVDDVEEEEATLKVGDTDTGTPDEAVSGDVDEGPDRAAVSGTGEGVAGGCEAKPLRCGVATADPGPLGTLGLVTIDGGLMPVDF
ncbi:hypothetical protein BGZ67_010614 [Mortierella alpina]|nr:hypothetical protein BGZ67_010614 [Mortierella alpina]